MDAKTAYNKGWATNPETRADIPVHNFRKNHGEEFAQFFIEGIWDKRDGLKKWARFDTTGEEAPAPVADEPAPSMTTPDEVLHRIQYGALDAPRTPDALYRIIGQRNGKSITMAANVPAAEVRATLLSLAQDPQHSRLMASLEADPETGKRPSQEWWDDATQSWQSKDGYKVCQDHTGPRATCPYNHHANRRP